jgi:hypothetical protein
MSRRHYERPQVAESAPAGTAVGHEVPVFAGRELTAEEFGRGGDLEQAFATHKKLGNGGRQVKMPPGKWASEFAAWARQERN